MKYKRPVERNEGPKPFSVGAHAAVITKVKNMKSKGGNDMFMLSLDGTDEEKVVYFLVFGNDYTEENFNYLMASIEDNGVEIPDRAFGFNQGTLEFLTGKEVYINVELQLHEGIMKPTVKAFFSQEEFENSDVEAMAEAFDSDGFN